MNISPLIEQWCQEAKYLKAYSPHTIIRYQNNTRNFLKYTGIMTPSEITLQKVLSFMMHGREERNWTVPTFRTYYMTLSVFFNFLLERGLIKENYMKQVYKPRVPKQLPKRISKNNAQKLLEVAQNYPYTQKFLRYRNHALFALFIYAGLRKHEVLGLTMIDVDLEGLSIFVRQGKGAKDRVVPISFTLADILLRYTQARKKNSKTCSSFICSSSKDQGLTNDGLKHLRREMRANSKVYFTWHMLRHTYATMMLEGGCDIYSLSKMLGHSDIKTTTIYLSASTEHLRKQSFLHPLENKKVSRSMEMLGA